MISKEYITKSELTATLLQLIENLDSVDSQEALHNMLEIDPRHDAYWQVINASEWSSTELVTIQNKGYLIQELISNVLIRRRKDQLHSFRQGLQSLGFLSLLEKHNKVAKHVLCYKKVELSVEQFI